MSTSWIWLGSDPDNPNAGVREMHDEWVRVKVEDGWVNGPVRDPKEKTHPNIVAFESLTDYEVAKDRLFLAVVRSMMEEGDVA